jgi:hypothetical protein
MTIGEFFLAWLGIALGFGALMLCQPERTGAPLEDESVERNGIQKGRVR